MDRALMDQVKTYTEDERQEHTERLAAMLEDDGETWDLSDNDKAALGMALEAVRLADKAVCTYCGHIGEKSSAAMADHALACEKRPEARLVDIVLATRDALNAAWQDLHDWRRLAEEQRRAHPDPDHAPHMPSQAGIDKTRWILDALMPPAFLALEAAPQDSKEGS